MLATLPRLLHPITLRAPNDGDAAFLARLYASTRLDLHSTSADPTFVAALVAMQQRLQAAGYRARFPGAAYLVLEHEGTPCGRIVVDAGAAALRLVDISLLPEWRGQGLGRSVLRALQGCAAGHRLPLVLAVHHANPAARRLYVALGFCAGGGDDHALQMVWDPEPRGPA